MNLKRRPLCHALSNALKIQPTFLSIGIFQIQSIFYELWRETGLLLSHLVENQTDWVSIVGFCKDVSMLCQKSVFDIFSHK